MEDKNFTVELTCLFCGCVLQGDTEAEYVSGDMIECQDCHELNDYDALIDIASEKGKEVVSEYAMNEVEAALKNMFK